MWCLLIISSCVVAVLAVPCDEGWLDSGAACYRLETTRRGWQEAEDACQTFGGHLVSLVTEDEVAFVDDMLIEVDSSGVCFGHKDSWKVTLAWIGLHALNKSSEDTELRSGWQWTDQAPYLAGCGWTRWAGGSEPAEGEVVAYATYTSRWGLRWGGLRGAGGKHCSICKVRRYEPCNWEVIEGYAVIDHNDHVMDVQNDTVQTCRQYMEQNRQYKSVDIAFRRCYFSLTADEDLTKENFTRDHAHMNHHYCRHPDYIGCFKDDVDRDLPYKVGVSEEQTPQACATNCKNEGYAYAGVQNGRECWCGATYGKHGPASNCRVACSGDSTQMCGYAWSNSVYQTGKESTSYNVSHHCHPHGQCKLFEGSGDYECDCDDGFAAVNGACIGCLRTKEDAA